MTGKLQAIELDAQKFKPAAMQVKMILLLMIFRVCSHLQPGPHPGLFW